jgi:type 2A phosphatase activator TIP41
MENQYAQETHLKAGPIDAMNEKLGIPVPEMIFGDNLVAIEHVPSGWAIDFNAFDALDAVSKTADGMLQVAYSKEWQKDRYVLHDFCDNVKSDKANFVRITQSTSS